MTVNCALVRDGTYPAILNHSQKINDNGAQANATLKIRNVAGKPLAGAAVFAQIESSIATIYRSRVDHRSASFALNETQAVEIARAMLGSEYVVLPKDEINALVKLAKRVAALHPIRTNDGMIDSLATEARRIVGSPA